MVTRLFKFVLVPLVLLDALLITSVAQPPFDDFSNFRQRRRAPSSAADNGPSFGEHTFVRVGINVVIYAMSH
jgi:hypothetical protein